MFFPHLRKGPFEESAFADHAKRLRDRHQKWTLFFRRFCLESHVKSLLRLESVPRCSLFNSGILFLLVTYPKVVFSMPSPAKSWSRMPGTATLEDDDSDSEAEEQTLHDYEVLWGHRSIVGGFAARSDAEHAEPFLYPKTNAIPRIRQCGWLVPNDLDRRHRLI